VVLCILEGQGDEKENNLGQIRREKVQEELVT
jgi:hypothetical protein